MQVFENEVELLSLRENYILGSAPIMNNSKIIFYGKNNILFCEDGVVLDDTTLEFGGSNSIVFLKKSKHNYRVSFKIFNNSNIYIDSDNYFNGVLNATASEEMNLFIGKNGMFSFGVWLMTTDHHLIYDINSLGRINFSKSIYIGDHVWIGQNSTILKGTKIDSGSIIGASSVVSGITVENNSLYAGNPARKIRDRIFWDGSCVHKWTKEKTSKSKKYNEYISENNSMNIEDYIYNYDDDSKIDYENIESRLKNSNLEQRLVILMKIAKNNNKNRFVHFSNEKEMGENSSSQNPYIKNKIN